MLPFSKRDDIAKVPRHRATDAGVCVSEQKKYRATYAATSIQAKAHRTTDAGACVQENEHRKDDAAASAQENGKLVTAHVPKRMSIGTLVPTQCPR